MGNIETPLGHLIEANDKQLTISLWNKDAAGHMEVTDDTNGCGSENVRFAVTSLT